MFTFRCRNMWVFVRSLHILLLKPRYLDSYLFYNVHEFYGVHTVVMHMVRAAYSLRAPRCSWECVYFHASFVLRAVVGGLEPESNAKVSGIRATLGFRSGTAALEEISYNSASPSGSRLRLHLTIDQSFKDRLAQAKKTSAGQWSPISLAPACPTITSTSEHSHGWKNSDDFVCSGNLIADLAATMEDGAQNAAHVDHGYSQPMAMETWQCGNSSVVDSVASTTTPADLSDLRTVDLLHLPADWNVLLSDVDVDADFAPLPDILPALSDLGSLFPPTGIDHVTLTNDPSGFLGAQLPIMSELFPVYDDVIGTCAVGDGLPMFDGIDDIWWNTFNIAHPISVK